MEIHKETDFNSMFIRRKKYCTAPTSNSVDDCEIYAPSVRSADQRYNGDVVYGCVKCKAGILGVVDTREASPFRGQSTIFNGTE